MARISVSRARTGRTGFCTGGTRAIDLPVMDVTLGPLAGFVAPACLGPVGRSSARIANAQITCIEQAVDQSLGAFKPVLVGSRDQG